MDLHYSQRAFRRQEARKRLSPKKGLSNSHWTSKTAGIAEVSEYQLGISEVLVS